MSCLSTARSFSNNSERAHLHTSNSVRSSLPLSVSSASKRTSLSLPQIPHPQSLREHLRVEDINIKGSRCSARDRIEGSARIFELPEFENLRKKEQEVDFYRVRKPKEKRPSGTQFPVDTIPDGIDVAFGDSKKLRLPVFGNLSRLSNQSEGNFCQTDRTGETISHSARIEVDEIEMLLRNQVNKQNIRKIKKRFQDNDSDGKGFVSREALHRIIITIVKKVFSQAVFVRLLNRLHLRRKCSISFQEFWNSLYSSEEENISWFDPIQRRKSPRGNPGVECLESHRSDKSSKSKERKGNSNCNGNRRDSLTEKNRNEVVFSPRKLMEKHKKAKNLEKWLKLKFREGFQNMKIEFENRDIEHKGLVPIGEFLKVLSMFGLRLEKSLLSAFLSHCGIKPQSEGIPYRDFLQRFQDRGEAGITHQVMANKKHRFHLEVPIDKKEVNPNRPITSLSSIETKLLHHFQKDFLLLLGIFKSCDVLHKGTVPIRTFQKILKDQCAFDFTDNEFEFLADNLPLDKNGDVKYIDFMKQFDTSCTELSLFKEQLNDSVTRKDVQKPSNQAPAPDQAPAPIPSIPRPKQSLSPELGVKRRQNGAGDCDMEASSPNRRSLQKLYAIIQNLLKNQYRNVEEAFYELDETNSGRLTQEMMFQLLKRFDITPKISRGEIRSLWEMCITNMDHTLDFYEFVRHFSFSLKTAAYPSAKICPPVKGDTDFMMRSKKLNCASDMLEDGLRAKIDYMFEDLQKGFLQIDPYCTGFVSKEEFQEILTELCPHLSDYELEILTKRFQEEADQRISYVQFLKPFIMKKQPWRHGKDMFSLLHQADSTEKKPIPQNTKPPQLTPNLRNKLTSEWKNLCHAFHKSDKENTGILTLAEFNGALKKANIVLSNEEKYQLMNRFDETLSGKIDYNNFLKEIIIPQRKVNRQN